MKTIKLLILTTFCLVFLSTTCKEESLIIEGENGLIYLDENDMTIKAYDIAQAGDMDILEGVTYTVVDSAMLYVMAVSGMDITNVVTTRITDMSHLFSGIHFKSAIRINEFNQDISSWDVSNVTDMSYMFHCCSFNQDISGWDVRNVTDMSYMFSITTNFNQDISGWDVSNVANMRYMFGGYNGQDYSPNREVPFNQDISGWDVSSVTDMYGMFYYATSFNQDISGWDVSKVTDCLIFNNGATSWTLPKPNFNSCECGCN